MSKIDKERIFNLTNTRWVRYSSYQTTCRDELGALIWEYVKEVENGSSAGYGNFHYTNIDEEITHIMPELMSGSDSSGSTTNRANYLAFIEMFGKNNQYDDINKHDEDYDCGFVEVYGGHDTYAIAISVKWLLDKKNYDQANKMVETLESLEEYPMLDEDKLSEYETELVEEEWSCWACYDYKLAIEKKFDCDIDCPTEDSEQDFREAFERVRKNENCEWQPENSSPSMWVDVQKIAENTSYQDIVTFIGK